MPRGSRQRNPAFTLLELIVATVIVAIVAALAAPALLSPASSRLRRAAAELVGHTRMARDLAMATRRRTWVAFFPGSNSYNVYIEHPSNPGKANRIYVANPLTGGNLSVALNTGDFVGVALTSARFGSGTELEFDRLGRPYDGNGSALTANGTVVLTAAGTTATVRVFAETGLVQEQ